MDSRGVYGLRINGLALSPELTVPQLPSAPSLTVTKFIRNRAHPPEGVPRAATILGGGALFLDYAKSQAFFQLEEDVDDAEMLHPWLAPAATLLWVALGHVVLHGGVLVMGGRAVVILGDPGAGKSSISAWALASGSSLHVFADDLAFLRGRQVMAGPRFIDLRPGTAMRLPHLSGRTVRGGTRARVKLGPASSSARVEGFVALAWGDRLRLSPVEPVMRIPVLLDHLAAGRHKVSASRVLELADIPVWRLERPRGWDHVDGVLDLLMSVVLGPDVSGCSSHNLYVG